MIRLLLIMLLLPCLKLSAQWPLSAWTATNGGVLYVAITNVSTNGTWSSFGLGTDNRGQAERMSQ